MRPPRLALWLLRIGSPSARVADVQGDLHELHAQRRERWGPTLAWCISSADALGVALAFGAHRLREGASEARRGVSIPDVRLGLRQIRKRPLLSVTSVLALAAGIGFANIGFGLIDGIAFQSLPDEYGDRFVRIETLDRERGSRTSIEVERFRALQDGARSLEYVGAKDHEQLNVFLASGEVLRVTSVVISPEAFRHLPAIPIRGRTLQPADGAPGAPPVVVVRESFWNSRFGAAEEFIGSTLRVAGTPRTVVGVLPDTFEFPNSPLLWVPLDEASLGGVEGWAASGIELFAVLGPGATIEGASSEVSALFQGFEDAVAGAAPIAPRVLGYAAVSNPGELFALLGGFITVLVLVLLVIASTVGNLFMARTASRTTELAVRASLGASRLRLTGQILAEMLVMVTLASVLAFSFSGHALRWFRGTFEEAPFWVEFEPSLLTVIAGAGAIFLVAITAGLVPARRAVSGDPSGALRRAPRGASPTRVGVLGSTLTVAEMALSVALVGSAIAAGRSVLRYSVSVPDIPYERVLTAEVRIELPVPTEPVPDVGAWQRDSVLVLRRAVLEAVRREPGVLAVGGATDLPGDFPASVRIEVDGLEVDGLDAGPDQETSIVGALPGYYSALGVEPVEGRGFEARDLDQGALPVVVVNDAFVTEVLRGRSAIGQRIRPAVDLAAGETPGPWMEVVGVVPDLGLGIADPSREAGYYIPMGGQRSFSLVVLVAGEPATFGSTLIRAAGGVDPRITMRRIVPLDQVASEESFALTVFGAGALILGGVAFVLCLVGTFVITSLEVTGRTREIGIRSALGASRRAVIMLLTRDTLRKLSIGAVGGGLLGWLVVRIVGGLSAGLQAGGPWDFLPLALALAATGALASWIPVRRALEMPPSEALAGE